MIEKTGCDMVMIGRGALGNPFIFQEINIYNKTEKLIPKPSVSQKLTVLLKHINLICKYKGECIGMKEARKHVAWYIKELKDAASFRNEAGSLKSLSELNQLVCKVYKAQYE
jgi:tRNA-dihydrouridine synthase